MQNIRFSLLGVLALCLNVGALAAQPDSLIYIYDDHRAYSGHCVEAVAEAYLQYTYKDNSHTAPLITWGYHQDHAAVVDFLHQHPVSHSAIALPVLVAIESGVVERRFVPTSDTPIDAKSFQWLIEGTTDSVASLSAGAHYPVSGNWWSVEGDWNPTKQKVILHLAESPNHDNEFELWWLNLLRYPELQSVHSDHHREKTNTGSVQWKYVNVESRSL